jgi:glycerophosphoryl diester phosphodiesterase
VSAPAAFRRRGGRPAVVGHRGVRGARPENTLAAFELAAREGADAVELDVRLCATGELVVCHDPDLKRVAGDARKVAALSLAELSRVDLGGGERVPRLIEVLDLCRRAGVGVNVELKRDLPHRASVVAAAAQLLTAWDPGHDVVVSSFDPWMLAGLRRLAPSLHCAQLVHRSRYIAAHLVAGRAAGARGVHLEASLWDPRRVASLRRRAGWIAAWTVVDPDEARRLADLGADAIITDVPGAIRAALDQPGGP